MPRLNADTSCRISRTARTLLLPILFFFLSVLAGSVAASYFLTAYADTVQVVPLNIYALCDLPLEFVLHACQLCLGTVVQVLIVWISAYVLFEAPLLCCVFLWRGLSFGCLFKLLLTSGAGSELFSAPILHAVITAILLLFSCHIRKESSPCTVSEAFVCALITGGICCFLVIFHSILHCI